MNIRPRIAPDSAWGAFYRRKGLDAVTRSTRPLTPQERLGEWLAKQSYMAPELRRVRA